MDDTARLDQLIGRLEAYFERTSSYPRWWQTWFSPATVVLAMTAGGIIWGFSARVTNIENSVQALQKDQESISHQLSNRIAVLDSTIVTKEWLTREISYQRDMYASKSSVELIGQRMDEFQRQLNTIQSGVERLSTDKGTPRR